MTPFWRLLPYVGRSIRRARVRSLLTVLGAALALGLIAFVLMLSSGVDRLEGASAERTLMVFQSSRFCPLTSLLPMRYESEIRSVPGVEEVLPTLLYINSCRSNLDLVTLHGVVGPELTKLHEFEVLDGSIEAWKDSSDGALVGRRLADRRKLSVGDRVRLTNVDVEVKGIVSGEGAGVDNIAFVHLAQLQRARGRQGIATEFLVRIAADADPQAVSSAIDARFATAEQTTETKPLQAFVRGAVGEVAEIVHFARWLGLLAAVVVVLVLANTVSIAAHSRRAELGTLETVGATRATLAGLLLSEGVMLGVLGAVVGVGAVAVWTHVQPLTLGIEGWGIDIEPTPRVLLVSFGAALAIGFFASLGPAIAVLFRPLAPAIKEA